MAEILEFPTREKQAFAFLEEQLRHMLSAKGADDRLIEHAIASLKDVYAELQRDSDCHFEVRLPEQLSREESLHLQEDIASGIAQLRKTHHNSTLKFAARWVLTDLKLSQHERSD